MIREATKEDYPSIERHARRFWEETYFKDDYLDGSALMYMDVALSQRLLFVAEVDGNIVGFAAGCMSPLMGNLKVMAGTEMAWWVDPEFRATRCGIGLLKALETSSKKQGCKYWSMVAMESSMPKPLQKLYKKMGYTSNEYTFTKRVN